VTDDAHDAEEARRRRDARDRWCDWSTCGPPCDHGGCFVGCFDCSLFALPGLLLGRLATATPGRAPRARASTPGRAGMLAIRGYQRWLSPHLPTRCRHVPTCSNFGLEAVRRYGLASGSRLTADRIRRCNAAVPHGTHDPVP
jgi:putative membrane protein insertion efficiency factor